MSNKYESLKKSIEEFYHCTPEYPLDVLRLIASATVKVQVKNQIDIDHLNTPAKICCSVDVDIQFTLILRRCHNTNINAYDKGHTCVDCKQWFCSEHQELHKFCLYCGKQMYCDLEKEIDNELNNKLNNKFGATEILDLLDHEEDNEDPYLRGTIESDGEIYDMHCCHVFSVNWTTYNSKGRCGDEAVIYCPDCKMCFCSKHLNGFCRCGKVVSLVERSKLLQEQCINYIYELYKGFN